MKILTILSLALLAASPAIAGDLQIIATYDSTATQTAYHVVVNKILEGVWKGFHVAEIFAGPERKILGLGLAEESGSSLKISFSQVNDNGELRVPSDEFIQVNGANSVLKLQNASAIALNCK